MTIQERAVAETRAVARVLLAAGPGTVAEVAAAAERLGLGIDRSTVGRRLIGSGRFMGRDVPGTRRLFAYSAADGTWRLTPAGAAFAAEGGAP